MPSKKFKTEKAQILSNIGNVKLDLGETKEAFKNFGRALEIFHATKAKKDEGDAWNNLGNVHHQIGNISKARQCFNKALEILRFINDNEGQAIASENLLKC